jgi:hypothetical protein
MCLGVVLARTDISEERIASIFRVNKNTRARNQSKQVAANAEQELQGAPSQKKNGILRKNKNLGTYSPEFYFLRYISR